MSEEIAVENAKRLYEWKQGACNYCGLNRTIFLYDASQGQWLCVDCLFKAIRKHLDASVDFETVPGPVFNS